MAVNWEELVPSRRTKPLVFALTRTLPHYRRPVFERLSEQSDFDIVFLHTEGIQSAETRIETLLLSNSHPVKMCRIGLGAWAFLVQWESVRRVMAYNPDAILCEASPNFLTVHLAAWRQWLRRQGVIYWSKGASPKVRNRLITSVKDFAFRIYARPATLAVGYGETSKPFFRKMGFDDQRIVIAQNTVDTDDILRNPDCWRQRGKSYRESLGLSDDATVLGVVSRLVSPKRIDLLIDAAGQLAKSDRHVAVLIGGTGPAEKQLREKAKGISHTVDVRFLGKLPIHGDNDVFAASDFNVFPGAVGLAIVQSLALGKPTICADEPFADSELIVHEQTGLRFERGNATALAQNIERLLKHPELACQLGQRGPDQIRARATVDNMVSQLAEAIRHTLRLRGRAS